MTAKDLPPCLDLALAMIQVRDTLGDVLHYLTTEKPDADLAVTAVARVHQIASEAMDLR